MNLAILKPEIQEFITNHLKSDITKLILKGSPFDNITVQELANQIIAKQKSEHKLPSWFTTQNIYYPEKIIAVYSLNTSLCFKNHFEY